MNNLKDYVNWKLTHADKTAEAEGYPLTMENCKPNKKMKQLEIYGNSVQDGTPTPDNPIEVESVGEKSVNLFDVDTYPLTVGACIWGNTGNASDYSYPQYALTVDYIPCADLRGKDITINHTLGSSVGGGFYDENKTFISGFQYKNATSKTITVPDTAFYYRFSVDANYIDEIQIQEGATATPYEPYGKYKIPVVQSGVNLFSISKHSATTQTINGITFTPLGDERIHIKGKLEDTTKAANYRALYKTRAYIKPGTYKAKPCKYSINGVTIQFNLSNGSGDSINISANYVSGNVTFNNAYINFAQIYISGTTVEFDDIIELQLMKGTEDLPYEPYIEPVTTNIFLDEPLRKIGDYADYVDFKENKVIRSVLEKQLLSSEPRTVGRGCVCYLSADIVKPYSTTSIGNIFCTHYQRSTWAKTMQPSGTSEAVCINSSANSIGFYDSKYAYDLTAFKNFLDANTLMIYVCLLTPTEETITLELPKLTAKTTIIEVDTSLAPSNAYGKYIKR